MNSVLLACLTAGYTKQMQLSTYVTYPNNTDSWQPAGMMAPGLVRFTSPWLDDVDKTGCLQS